MAKKATISSIIQFFLFFYSKLTPYGEVVSIRTIYCIKCHHQQATDNSKSAFIIAMQEFAPISGILSKNIIKPFLLNSFYILII